MKIKDKKLGKGKVMKRGDTEGNGWVMKIIMYLYENATIKVTIV